MATKKEERADELKRGQEIADIFNAKFQVGNEIAVIMGDRTRAIMVLKGGALARLDPESNAAIVEALVGKMPVATSEDDLTVLTKDIRPRSIERKKATDALRVMLTDEEIRTENRTVVDGLGKVAKLKADLDSLKSSINSQIKMGESEIANAAELARNGYRVAPVDLDVIIDYDLGRVRKIRKDTGEQIEDRMIMDAERNSEPLPLVQPEPKALELVKDPEPTTEGKPAGGPATPQADPEKPKAERPGLIPEGTDMDDLKRAIEVLKMTKRAGATALAKALNVSTRRSVQILDALTAKGITGPVKENGDPRDILVDLDKVKFD